MNGHKRQITGLPSPSQTQSRAAACRITLRRAVYTGPAHLCPADFANRATRTALPRSPFQTAQIATIDAHTSSQFASDAITRHPSLPGRGSCHCDPSVVPARAPLLFLCKHGLRQGEETMRSAKQISPKRRAGAKATRILTESLLGQWLALLMLAGTVCLFGTANAEELGAELSDVTGYALIQRGQTYLPTASAMTLKPGDTVIVMEKSKAKVTQGNCTLPLSEGSVYTIKAFPDCNAARASIVRVEASFLPATRRPPGSVQVDVEAAERALERTLTEQGALLLPKGFMEVSPSVAYTRRETTTPVFANVGSLVLANVDTKRNEVQANLNLKVGLPWTSQLEIGLPYNFVDQSAILNLGSAGRITSSGSANGFGDIQIALAKQLLREKGVLPDLVFRVIYGTGSGDRGTNDVTLDSGYPSLGGQLTFLKRQDPLAFVANIAYTKKYERDNIEPGDQFSFSVGAVLAASPDTSLQFSFAQAISRDIRVNGTAIRESDQNQGILSIGASSILGKGVLLNLSVGIGVTNDAPDYVVQLSLPIRFSL